MTKKERRKPDILQASRKRRIAAGAGVEVAEINRLLKQHRQMQDAFKMMARGGGKGFARMAGMMGLGGPGGADALEALGRAQAGAGGEGSPQLPGLGGASPLPGLGGQPFNPFRKP
jgi:signal recognition particle subunit SRP54